jgi:TRAP transporter TAXI family solute receptor
MRCRIGRCVCAVAVLCATSCSHDSASNGPIRVRIAGGPRNATFFIVSNALAALYSEHIANVSVQAVETTGSTDNLEAIETGNAECAIASADLVYDAHVRGTSRLPRPYTHLRGVAVLFPNTVHLVTRADSLLKTLASLSGKRIAAAVPGDVTTSGRGFRLDSIASAIADAAPSHVRPTIVVTRMDDAVGELERGDVDAVHFYGGYPFRPVTQAAERYGIRFIEFDDLMTSTVKAKYPFSKPVIIPAGTYAGQDAPVRTLAIDNVLSCRSDLPTDLVYRLTLTLYQGLASMAAVHASAKQINAESGAATPIPLHDGAARYYRERELFR